uniref:Uncharacterized protein n=1 Tax=Sphaerodactylus townsendi TaxID=933632 RepID=A0ACB8G104_9SAUR
MSLRKRKPSTRFWKQKSSDPFRSCLACDIEEGADLEAQTSAASSHKRRVRFMIDLPTRESGSERGDTPNTCPGTHFKNSRAIMKEKLESKGEIPDLKLSMSEWDIDSEGTDLQTTQSALDSREEEFLLTAKSCDEALRENQEIRELMSSNEERGKRKVTMLRRKLEEAKGDNLKVTTILENVLASHRKMEKALEKAHTELGRKDSELAGLKKDRTHSQQRIQNLEAELEQCHSQLALESQHGIKTDPLRKILEVTKGDKKKLAQNLEQTLESNSLLQSKLERLREELESKEAEYQQLVECRCE